MFFSLCALGRPVRMQGYSRWDEHRNPDEHSRISPDGIEYVLPYSDQVLPFFLVTYCEHGAQVLGMEPAVPKPKSAAALKKEQKLEKEKEKERKKQPRPAGLTALRVPGDARPR